jgi:hypothetical protein
MTTRYLFRSAVLAVSLSSVTACVQEAPRADPRPEVTVTAGHIRMTAGAPTSSVAQGLDGAAIDLETVAASRGDTALDVTALDILPAPGTVTTLRADFVETVRDTGEGAEQSWQFPSVPGSAGDLVIAIDASGSSTSAPATAASSFAVRVSST